ncbi:MAG TPA: DUF1365 domain-containing protein [Caulobacteraceae bacterium]
MTGLAGDLYQGETTHLRFGPRPHRLRYSMFQILIDIDAARRLNQTLFVFSHNRFNLFSFYDADHGDGRAHGLRAWVDETLLKGGIDLAGGEVRLLCMPRVLGHVFNPISLYFCRRACGQLAAMIYEVNNTFGERHFYLIPGEEVGGQIVQSCVKRFYVSPFMDMAMTYEFKVLTPGERIRVAIKGRNEDDELVIAASFSGKRLPLSDKSLMTAFVANPFLTLKVVGAIRFEAARLLLKGLRPRSRPPLPATPVTFAG